MTAYTITLWICLIGHTDVCVGTLMAREVIAVPAHATRAQAAMYHAKCATRASAMIKDIDPMLKPFGVEAWVKQGGTCVLRRGA